MGAQWLIQLLLPEVWVCRLDIAHVRRRRRWRVMSAEDDCESENWFLNYYRCEECGHEWTDEWSCACGDTCPECGVRDTTPYKSEDLDGPPPSARGELFAAPHDVRGSFIWEMRDRAAA